jgi:hypothetical protein
MTGTNANEEKQAEWGQADERSEGNGVLYVAEWVCNNSKCSYNCKPVTDTPFGDSLLPDSCPFGPEIRPGWVPNNTLHCNDCNAPVTNEADHMREHHEDITHPDAIKAFASENIVEV